MNSASPVPYATSASRAPFECVGDWLGLDGVLAATRAGLSRETTVNDRRYCCDLLYGRGALAYWAAALGTAAGEGAAAWVVADRSAWELHGKLFLAAPGAAERVRGVLHLDVGEHTKSAATWERILDWLCESQAGRRDVLVAFGGATVSDVAGFAAATYMRGIPHLVVPTTLVAQEDGAVGGKVAIDRPQARNLVGAFHHPVAIVSDTEVLCTLPAREVSCGLSEAIKTVAVASEQAFAFLEPRIELCRRGNASAFDEVVRVCVAIKNHLLARDPFEVDLRRALNFGHTLAHPIETVYGYDRARHGEAVAVGMAVAVRIGVARGLTPRPVADRLVSAIRAAGLPLGIEESVVPEILERLQVVLAIRDGAIRYVIPRAMGRIAIVNDVSPAEISAALPAEPSL